MNLAEYIENTGLTLKKLSELWSAYRGWPVAISQISLWAHGKKSMNRATRSQYEAFLKAYPPWPPQEKRVAHAHAMGGHVVVYPTKETGKKLYVVGEADNPKSWVATFRKMNSALKFCVRNDLVIVNLDE